MLLREQLRIYGKYDIHWSRWLYEDIGPLLDEKRQWWADSWGRRPSAEIRVDRRCSQSTRYFRGQYHTRSECHVPADCWHEGPPGSRIFITYLADSLPDELGETFLGVEEKALGGLARSFPSDGCVQRYGLNYIWAEYARLTQR